jgi:UDP-N-acetylglucosamine--N-acetylmuramyl-(pentapeptide) pyrophosphoryl-undecaprenol N-acetylglucosamine transferase
MKVIFAGGGTGGHLYPALALADEMRARIHPFEALFVGTKLGMETKILREYGYDVRFLSSRGMRGKKIFGKVNTMFSLAVGILQALIIQWRFKPDLVIGFGGYASAALVIASYVSRCRVLIQEQNSIPGITNRVLSRIAGRVYLGFESAAKYLKKRDNIVITGNPLRKVMTDSYSGKPHESFGLKEGIPILLVFGGSQGAHSLNHAAVEYFLSNNEVQGIVQTGSSEYEWVKERLGKTNGVFVCDYISNIRDAYEIAEIALARAGALTVSEFAAIGLPSILVPYPYSVDDHQTYNARFLASAGAAVVINDSELDGERLASVLGELLEDKDRLESMKRSALKVGIRDATSKIVDDIVEFSEKGLKSVSKDNPVRDGERDFRSKE